MRAGLVLIDRDSSTNLSASILMDLPTDLRLSVAARNWKDQDARMPTDYERMLAAGKAKTELLYMLTKLIRRDLRVRDAKERAAKAALKRESKAMPRRKPKAKRSKTGER